MTKEEKEALSHLRRATNDGQDSVVLASNLENQFAWDRAEATRTISAWHKYGWGRRILGRRGHDTRFWLRASGVAAIDKAKEENVRSIPEEAATVLPLVRHSFQLRTNLEVFFSLPIDMTEREATRLSRFIETLPI